MVSRSLSGLLFVSMLLSLNVLCSAKADDPCRDTLAMDIKRQILAVNETDGLLIDHWPKYTEQQRRQVVWYLEARVFPDQRFLNNPVDYIAQWQKNRGSSEQLLVPDDLALALLQKLFQEKELDSFVNLVKDGRFGIKTDMPLLSDTWPKNSD